MTICAIHQPNFFPWIPYFDKISQADIFVFLDNVDYPKSGNSMGSWCNRVHVSHNNQKHYFSYPVIRKSGKQIIKDVLLNKSLINKDNINKKLSLFYKNHKNFTFINELILESLDSKFVTISELNIYLIEKISNFLGLKTKFIRQTSLVNNNLKSNEMLVDLCKQVGSTTYLSGKGAKNYLSKDLFLNSKINLSFQDTNFLYDNYQLSIIDFLLKTPCSSWTNFNDKK